LEQLSYQISAKQQETPSKYQAQLNNKLTSADRQKVVIAVISPLKPEIHLIKFSDYLTENTVYLPYKDKLTDVWGNHLRIITV
jgi:hypothetical protein